MSVQMYLPARRAKDRGETLTRYALIVRDMGTRGAMGERDARTCIETRREGVNLSSSSAIRH
jgi:hypothetical protein